LFVRDQLVVVEAARAGARQAAVTDDVAEIRSAVVGAAASLDPGALQLDIERLGRGQPVTVGLTYEDRATVPGVGWLLPQSVTLHSNATMRQEFG